MSFAIQPLPEDLDALRSFAADLQAELARKDIEITVRDADIGTPRRCTSRSSRCSSPCCA